MVALFCSRVTAAHPLRRQVSQSTLPLFQKDSADVTSSYSNSYIYTSNGSWFPDSWGDMFSADRTVQKKTILCLNVAQWRKRSTTANQSWPLRVAIPVSTRRQPDARPKRRLETATALCKDWRTYRTRTSTCPGVFSTCPGVHVAEHRLYRLYDDQQRSSWRNYWSPLRSKQHAGNYLAPKRHAYIIAGTSSIHYQFCACANTWWVICIASASGTNARTRYSSLLDYSCATVVTTVDRDRTDVTFMILRRLHTDAGP